MPLRYGTSTTPTDPGTGGAGGGGASGGGGIISAADPASVAGSGGNMSAIWTAPDGTVWQLTEPDVGWFTRTEITGWGATTYEITTDPNARGGETVRHIRAQPGRLNWPLHIFGDSHQEFVNRERQIKRAIAMTVHRGLPGLLRVSRPDGGAREIEAYYEEGFGGNADEMYKSANPVITFFCPDGYWRDVAAIVERRAYAPASNFFSRFPTISGSNVLGDTIINNPGDVTAWPEWEISGPATQLIATNKTTGQSFTLTYSLLAGETVTITTDRPTVRGPAGENIVSALNWPGAYLWGLTPGENVIQFTAGGGGKGSEVKLSFHARYEGA